MSKNESPVSWERNTSGIKAAALRKREEAFIRADEAIKTLIREKKPINFESVSEQAGVTRQWLYRESDLRSRIETLRAQQSPKKAIPKSQSASDGSKDAIIKTLRARLRKTEEENKELQERIQIAYGMAQVDFVESLEAENKDLEKQNKHLMKLLTEARAEIDGLKVQRDTLKDPVPY